MATVCDTYLLKTPPSSEAFRHSGGDSRRCTSPTVTLYLDVELSSDRRPGTEQNTSVGDVRPVMTISLLSLFRGLIPAGARGQDCGRRTSSALTIGNAFADHAAVVPAEQVVRVLVHL